MFRTQKPTSLKLLPSDSCLIPRNYPTIGLWPLSWDFINAAALFNHDGPFFNSLTKTFEKLNLHTSDCSLQSFVCGVYFYTKYKQYIHFSIMINEISEHFWFKQYCVCENNKEDKFMSHDCFISRHHRHWSELNYFIWTC